jgi:hypothetical protein
MEEGAGILSEVRHERVRSLLQPDIPEGRWSQARAVATSTSEGPFYGITKNMWLRDRLLGDDNLVETFVG